MISHVGRVSIENYKTVKGIQKEEVEGKIEEKEVDVTLRFDFVVPMGSPYEVCYEALKDFTDEIKKMEENSKKQQEEANTQKPDEEVEG